MTNQITLEQALKLVTFREVIPGSGDFAVDHVHGPVYGNIYGNVRGTIEGRRWQFVETPRERLKRLIDEGADTEQLIEQCILLEQVND